MKKQREPGYLSLRIVDKMVILIDGQKVRVDVTTDEVIGLAIVFRSKEDAERHGKYIEIDSVSRDRNTIVTKLLKTTADPEPNQTATGRGKVK
jgi:hypothetical protein